MNQPNWLLAVEQLAPVIAGMFIPGPAGQILGGIISHGISDAEAIPGANGSSKLQSAINLTNDAVAGINAVRPNTIDPTLVSNTSANIINTVISTANLIKNTPPKSTAPSA